MRSDLASEAVWRPPVSPPLVTVTMIITRSAVENGHGKMMVRLGLTSEAIWRPSVTPLVTVTMIVIRSQIWPGSQIGHNKNDDKVSGHFEATIYNWLLSQ